MNDDKQQLSKEIIIKKHEPAGRWEQLSGVDTLRNTLQHEAALQKHKHTHIFTFTWSCAFKVCSNTSVGLLFALTKISLQTNQECSSISTDDP